MIPPNVSPARRTSRSRPDESGHPDAGLAQPWPHRLWHRPARRAAAASLLLAGLTACGAGDPPASSFAQPAPPVASLATRLDADAPAGAQTTVVLEVKASSAAGLAALPYRFEHDEVLHRCIPADDHRLISARLERGSDEVLWEHRRGEPCPGPTDIPAGAYRLVVQHEATDAGFVVFLPGSGSGASAQDTPVRAPLPAALPDTEPGEYIVLQQGEQTLRAEGPGFVRRDAGRLLLQPDLQTWALFSLRTVTIGGVQHQILQPRDPRPGDTEPFVLCPRSGRTTDFTLEPRCGRLPADDPAPTVRRAAALRSTGGTGVRYCYASTNGPSVDTGLVSTWCLSRQADGVLGFLNASAASTGNPDWTLKLRYRVDASGYRPRRGEVAVFTDSLRPGDGPNAAFIVSDDSPLPVAGIDRMRVRTGPDTSVAVNQSGWINGSALLGGFNGKVPVVRLRESRELLISTGACVGCDLSGLDLSGLDLDGADLRYARFRGAKLENTRLRGAKLLGADFSEANLGGAEFQDALPAQGGPRPTQLAGTVFDGADLRGAIFTGAALGCVSMRDTRLEQARFAGTALQCVDLSGARLSQAWFVNSIRTPGLDRAVMEDPSAGQCDNAKHPIDQAPDALTGLFPGVPCKALRLVGAQVWTDAPPVPVWKHADMTGAVIRSARGDPVAQAALSEADLRGGRFSGVRFDGATMRKVRFDGADLARAAFVGSDLGCPTGAAAPCSTFNRASMRGADLSFAVATGADFTEAVLGEQPAPPGVPGGPEIPGATMSFLFAPRSNFTAADLTGVDLSNAQLYGPGTRFDRATAVRTGFRGATLTSVDFTETRLQGADFTDANLLLASFARVEFGRAADASPTRFVGALLQGARLSGVQAPDTNFRGATFALREGSITVRHEQRPGVFYDRSVSFCPTAVPTPLPSTLCPGTSTGLCTDWSTPAPRQPTCVPTEQDACAASYRAADAVPFSDQGPRGLSCP